MGGLNLTIHGKCWAYRGLTHSKLSGSSSHDDLDLLSEQTKSSEMASEIGSDKSPQAPRYGRVEEGRSKA